MNTTTAMRTVDPSDLQNRVKAMYQKVALEPEVKYHFELGRSLAERLAYPNENLNKIPAQSIESFAGVGYFFDMADIRKGEYVTDLGSGSGMDTFYAAQQVGSKGEVTGIDMTYEQVNKSEMLKYQQGFDQVIFRNAHIEELPIVSGTMDVVISNGVINLSSQKSKVFKEAARILKKGGRLAISDIVTELALPESITCNATLWAACIGGAMQKDEYLALIEAAGMEVIEVKTNPYAFISNSAKGATADYGISSVSILAVKK